VLAPPEIVSTIGARALAKARTRYYRTRYRRFVVWGEGVQVLGRLRLRGPGRIVIGDGCLLNGLNIASTGDVMIGARAHVVRQLHFDGAGRLVIGDGCMFDGYNAIHCVRSSVTIRIGDECYVNGVDIVATEDVTIGDRCILGECSMVTTDYHSARPDRWSPDAPVKTGPITIGSNVWIAAKAVITKNVSIGDNSVVSIGTIVREDVSANVIVSSQEQRVVKKLDDCPPMTPTTWPTWWQRERN
jgi:acetyltransferase-like isoleucine patch superfamily enzyme